MKRILFYIIAVTSLFVPAGCGHDPEDVSKPEPDPAAVKRAVLVYAVNRSSLSMDFKDDSSEMLEAMRTVDSDSFQLLVFRTDDEDSCGLYQAVPASGSNDGEYEFRQIKSYERDVLSTHPDRISEVIDYALTLYPNAAYDLIFWGHGMSWKPYFTDHNVVTPPELYSYGGEYNGNGIQTDWTEIDELADAVPSGRFETIWFDCCYMSGIETIYQFRDKCDTFVGYPSEVWQYGMAYDLVLPYLLRETPDVIGGAKAFYDYYAHSGDPVTVAVTDLEKLEPLADVASEILYSGPERPSINGLVNYSRTSGVPFYDFQQFLTSVAGLNGRPELADALADAMNDAVIYHAESDRNFNLRPWDSHHISGISMHNYLGTESRDETYYRSLDWYQRVYR